MTSAYNSVQANVIAFAILMITQVLFTFQKDISFDSKFIAFHVRFNPTDEDFILQMTLQDYAI